MRLVDTTCPRCGATLKIDEDNKQAKCEFCDTSLFVDDEVHHVQYDNAEEAGYKFEKGRQKAQQEIKGTQQPQIVYVKQEPPKKKRTWLWALGWICIFPLPLTILMLRNKSIDKRLRIGIIILAWVVYSFIGLSGGETQKIASSASAPQTNSASASTAKENTDDTANIQPTSAETDDSNPLVITQSDYYIENGYLNYMVYLQNTSNSLAVTNPCIRITARDSGGKVLGTTDQGIFVVYPNQEVAFGTLGFEVSDEPATVDFDIVDYETRAASSLSWKNYIPVKVCDYSINDSSIVGELNNENAYDIESVWLTLVFRDSSGRMTRIEHTFADKVSANVRTPFNCYAFDVNTENTCEVYTLIWDYNFY